MISFSLAFLSGVLFLQTFSSLPDDRVIIFLFFIILFIHIILKSHWQYLCLPSAFLLGFIWAFFYAHLILSWSIPSDLEGQPILVQGIIHSIPHQERSQTSFLFSAKKYVYQGKINKINTLMQLSTRDLLLPFRLNEEWYFKVKLKNIWGMRNPGGFDYEAHALWRGVRAKGYIVISHDNQLIRRHHQRLSSIRQTLYEKMTLALPPSRVSHWLIALMVGERTGIPPQEWQVLKMTGTNHLMAIAGLHIGLLSGFFFRLVTWLWARHSILSLYITAEEMGAIAALLVGFIYAGLAGFSLPTQRACMMLAIAMLALLSRRSQSPWHAWSFALLCVLFYNPLSVLTESFWLSFGTIALIIYGMRGRLAPGGWWWKWGRVQWVIGIGLIPLTIALFQECSLISFIANTIAIPWLGFFILPFVFVGGLMLFFLPDLGKIFLVCSDKTLDFLWTFLSYLSHWPFSSYALSLPHYGYLILAMIGFIFLLFPTGMPGRYLGVIWLLPCIFYHPEKPNRGDFWVTILDVGQGLSIVVQTHQHLLVYDTGAKLNENYDMGESVVLPYLRTLHAKKLDRLIVSHGDNDHAGGAGVLIKALPISLLLSSVPEKFKEVEARLCLAGHNWVWDNVHFRFLYPPVEKLHLGNDSSCVLQIDNGQQRVLLTGDIEKLAENYLIEHAFSFLPADILVAPHHGSKTSGMKAFIDAVYPSYVIYSIGYRNRYHFPHPSVVATYKNLGVKQLDTMSNGAIFFKIEKNKKIHPPICYRLAKQGYWQYQ